MVGDKAAREGGILFFFNYSNDLKDMVCNGEGQSPRKRWRITGHILACSTEFGEVLEFCLNLI